MWLSCNSARRTPTSWTLERTLYTLRTCRSLVCFEVSGGELLVKTCTHAPRWEEHLKLWFLLNNDLYLRTQVARHEPKWRGMNPSGKSWTQVARDEPKWQGMNPIGKAWTQVTRHEPKWQGMNPSGKAWTQVAVKDLIKPVQRSVTKHYGTLFCNKY